MIQALTIHDAGLAQVANTIAERFFRDLAGDWRIGARVHLAAETFRLYADGDSWPVGSLDVLALPGDGGVLVADVDKDFTATLDAHGVHAAAAALCLRGCRLILICARRFDLRGDTLRAMLIHELAHATAPMLPKHGCPWRSRMLWAARAARRAGALTLAAAVEADVGQYSEVPACRTPAAIGKYMDGMLAERTRARGAFKITVEGGQSLSDWLARRRGT